MIKKSTNFVFCKNKIMKIIIIIFVFFLLFGLTFALFLNIFSHMSFGCTNKMCYPDLNEGYFEVPCNDCVGEGTYFFYSIVMNFKKICFGREIMIFEDGYLIDARIDIGECRYVIHFLR